MLDQIVTAQLPIRAPRRTVGLAMSAVVIAVALFVFWPSGEGASPQAARALRRAAEVARSQPALPAPTQEEYLYTRIQNSETSIYVAGSGQSSFSFITSTEVESWIAPDGSGRVLSDPIGVGFPTTEDESAWQSAGSPNLKEPPSDKELDEGGPTPDLAGVPTAPDELLKAIERREIIDGDDTDLVTFEIIGELLHLSYGSPRHRAALFEAAADFAGVDFEGSVTDPTGRPGVSVSFDGDGQRHELIIDPATSELLAERRTVLDPQKAGVDVPPDARPATIIDSAGPPETVVLWRLYLDTAVVDSIDPRSD